MIHTMMQLSILPRQNEELNGIAEAKPGGEVDKEHQVQLKSVTTHSGFKAARLLLWEY